MSVPGSGRLSGRIEPLPRVGSEAETSDRVTDRTAAPTQVPRPPVQSPVQPASTPARRRGGRRRGVLAIMLLAVAGFGGWYGYRWWTDGRFMVWTDDAYVGAKTVILAAKVPGYISSLNVEDNAFVHGGDVIAIIDDGDYKLALESARARTRTQQATVERIGRQIKALEAAVEQAKAQLVSAQAGAARAKLEFDRQQSLTLIGGASKQVFEQAYTNRDQGDAAVLNAKAAVDAAEANVAVARSQQEEARQTVSELEMAAARAERDLSFTVIRAPFDGVVGNRAIQAGGYVQAGTRLVSVVPLDDVYIDANFKETQLARIRPGAHVSILVDALPDVVLDGTVESIAPASGSVFSLLPPDNATGNFTKIVQRLPVRIRVAPEVAEQGALRPGMSVAAGVDTRTGAMGAPPVSITATPTAPR
ncbi:membrane fusion protein, multidrug efflux system [Enhydrobacter aerosaccus]|uniref:Membrane fusion protein, multidrug efflux system n=1 Tax=Enhydrobacter aerosaccus TaxID=225324 RepID=A0A1T4LHJ1_9HYPH|nr:HlyD family secretion protein [Enhydrobacter aerosaccus]SJZ54068.1 membrane fusion protein, multidrug efflux system [Enhydrobacter aerosaccus]